MAEQTAVPAGGAWVLFELDSGKLATFGDDGVGGPDGKPSTRLVAFADREAAEAWALKVFGAEAGKEWRPGHLNSRELKLALAGGTLPLTYGGEDQ